MTRTIKVGITFEFEPDTEHADLFEGMTLDQIIVSAKSMASEDFDRLVKYGEVFESLSVEVVEN